MSTQQYKRHAHHELSYVEIRRRLHLDPTQLHPIIGFIESECIKHGIPQSGHNMTALVPWQNAQKHVLEAVLNDVVKKFMPATFPPVGTSPEDARNALRAIVHNIRRAQRERNTRPRGVEKKAAKSRGSARAVVADKRSKKPVIPATQMARIESRVQVAPAVPSASAVPAISSAPVPPAAAPATISPLPALPFISPNRAPSLINLHGLTAEELSLIPGTIVAIEPSSTAGNAAITGNTASIVSLGLAATRALVEVWYRDYAGANLFCVIL